MSRRLRDAALLALLGCASAFLAVQILRFGEPSLPPPAESAPPPDTTPEPFALPEPRPVPLGQLATALERPLFAESRRPPAAPAAPPSRLEATLAGILTDGPEKVAIVVIGGADRALRLSKGDVFQGWRVREIEDAAITLERAGRTERLVLTFRGSPAPAPE